jgi:hypothetical protein
MAVITYKYRNERPPVNSARPMTDKTRDAGQAQRADLVHDPKNLLSGHRSTGYVYCRRLV